MSSLESGAPPGAEQWRAPQPDETVVDAVALHGLDGPFFNPAGLDITYRGQIELPEPGRWSNQYFYLSDTKIIDVGGVSATRGSRIRAVMTSLAENPDNLQAVNAPNQPIERNIKEVEQYLARPVRSFGPETTNGVLLPHELILSIIEQAWQAENNPILQCLMQLRSQYKDELSPIAMKQLARDIMYGTQSTRILQMYATHKKALKQLPEDK